MSLTKKITHLVECDLVSRKLSPAESGLVDKGLEGQRCTGTEPCDHESVRHGIGSRKCKCNFASTSILAIDNAQTFFKLESLNPLILRPLRMQRITIKRHPCNVGATR